jgi:hypothetical protein
MAGEVSLGNELLVGLDDHSSRDPELRGQRPGRWQRGSRPQPPAAHRAAQLVLELGVQRTIAVAADRDEELAGATGPDCDHGSGSYIRTSRGSSWTQTKPATSISAMAVLPLLILVAVLLALGLLALRHGADSREHLNGGIRVR